MPDRKAEASPHTDTTNSSTWSGCGLSGNGRPPSIARAITAMLPARIRTRLGLTGTPSLAPLPMKTSVAIPADSSQAGSMKRAT